LLYFQLKHLMKPHISFLALTLSIKIQIAHPEHPALRRFNLLLRLLQEWNHELGRIYFNRNLIIFQLCLQ
jgi:hypothetical protein